LEVLVDWIADVMQLVRGFGQLGIEMPDEQLRNLYAMIGDLLVPE